MSTQQTSPINTSTNSARANAVPVYGNQAAARIPVVPMAELASASALQSKAPAAATATAKVAVNTPVPAATSEETEVAEDSNEQSVANTAEEAGIDAPDTDVVAEGQDAAEAAAVATTAEGVELATDGEVSGLFGGGLIGLGAEGFLGASAFGIAAAGGIGAYGDNSNGSPARSGVTSATSSTLAVTSPGLIVSTPGMNGNALVMTDSLAINAGKNPDPILSIDNLSLLNPSKPLTPGGLPINVVMEDGAPVLKIDLGPLVQTDVKLDPNALADSLMNVLSNLASDPAGTLTSLATIDLPITTPIAPLDSILNTALDTVSGLLSGNFTGTPVAELAGTRLPIISDLPVVGQLVDGALGIIDMGNAGGLPGLGSAGSVPFIGGLLDNLSNAAASGMNAQSSLPVLGSLPLVGDLLAALPSSGNTVGGLPAIGESLSDTLNMLPLSAQGLLGVLPVNGITSNIPVVGDLITSLTSSAGALDSLPLSGDLLGGLSGFGTPAGISSTANPLGGLLETLSSLPGVPRA